MIGEWTILIISTIGALLFIQQYHKLCNPKPSLRYKYPLDLPLPACELLYWKSISDKQYAMAKGHPIIIGCTCDRQWSFQQQ
jgi:hypothetical protein